MNLARRFAVTLTLLSPGLGSAQEKNDLGKWTPLFRTDQIFSGDVTVESGKITWDNKLHLTIGSQSVILKDYRNYSTTQRAVAYRIYGNATRVILRDNYPLCREQPKWIVFANTYNPNEERWELEIVLSITNPAHPTSPNSPNFAEKVAFSAAYIPGTMEEMHDGDAE